MIGQERVFENIVREALLAEFPALTASLLD